MEHVKEKVMHIHHHGEASKAHGLSAMPIELKVFGKLGKFGRMRWRSLCYGKACIKVANAQRHSVSTEALSGLTSYGRAESDLGWADREGRKVVISNVDAQLKQWPHSAPSSQGLGEGRTRSCIGVPSTSARRSASMKSSNASQSVCSSSLLRVRTLTPASASLAHTSSTLPGDSCERASSKQTRIGRLAGVRPTSAACSAKRITLVMGASAPNPTPTLRLSDAPTPSFRQRSTDSVVCCSSDSRAYASGTPAPARVGSVESGISKLATRAPISCSSG
eukprot:scaffold117231_cov32-Tisochrysis_lutea.AAC.6